MEGQAKTSMGLEQNVAGLLCYAFQWVTGLIFYFVEKDNKFVKFHAMQSILTFGGLYVLNILMSILSSIFWAILWRGAGLWTVASLVSSLFSIISTIIWIATVALWILLMVKAYQNETFKLPIVGKIAEKQLQ